MPLLAAGSVLLGSAEASLIPDGVAGLPLLAAGSVLLGLAEASLIPDGVAGLPLLAAGSVLLGSAEASLSVLQRPLWACVTSRCRPEAAAARP